MKTLIVLVVVYVLYVIVKDKVITINLTLLKARYAKIKKAVTSLAVKIKSLILKLKKH
jgi:hypothetical protein